MGPIGQFGIGEARGDGKDGSADAAINSRDHEGGQPHAKDLHADIGGLAGILADRAQVQTDGDWVMRHIARPNPANSTSA